MIRRLRTPTVGMLVILLAIAAFLAGNAFVPGFAHLVEPLSDWDGLIGGAVAIIAAVYGARHVLGQIEQTEEIERERSRRAAVAARAILPLSLSAVSGHARQVMEVSRKILVAKGRVSRPRGGMPAFPSLSREVLEDIHAFILTAPDEPGEQAAQIISELQVLAVNGEAMWADLSAGRSVPATNLQVVTARAALIYARTSVLYPYARRETDQTPRITGAEVAQALMIVRLYPAANPELERIAAGLLRTAPLAVPGEVAA